MKKVVLIQWNNSNAGEEPISMRWEWFLEEFNSYQGWSFNNKLLKYPPTNNKRAKATDSRDRSSNNKLKKALGRGYRRGRGGGSSGAFGNGHLSAPSDHFHYARHACHPGTCPRGAVRGPRPLLGGLNPDPRPLAWSGPLTGWLNKCKNLWRMQRHLTQTTGKAGKLCTHVWPRCWGPMCWGPMCWGPMCWGPMCCPK